MKEIKKKQTNKHAKEADQTDTKKELHQRRRLTHSVRLVGTQHRGKGAPVMRDSKSEDTPQSGGGPRGQTEHTAPGRRTHCQ